MGIIGILYLQPPSLTTTNNLVQLLLIFSQDLMHFLSTTFSKLTFYVEQHFFEKLEEQAPLTVDNILVVNLVVNLLEKTTELSWATIGRLTAIKTFTLHILDVGWTRNLEARDYQEVEVGNLANSCAM